METEKGKAPEEPSLLAQEYKVLHEVAQTLQSPLEIKVMLQNVLNVITQFEELKVEKKAGIFLANHEKKVLQLYTTVGQFSDEFLEKEKEVPFGNCLCGRAAASGELIMSESCFTDSRHERIFEDMTAHGHYIVPLKSQSDLVGIMFLYTNTYPSWYQHSQDVLLSIGGLIADAIKRKQIENELERYRNHLENLVDSKTSELTETNEKLKTSRDQFRKLSNQIQTSREEEKSRISREVHDRLGQSLTALKMDSSYIGKKLPRDLAEIKGRVESMTQLIDDTIKSVQEIATELRPPILDAFGLCEAIAWQADEYRKRIGIEFDLNCLQEDINLSKDLKTALFRIFQETLTNIARHAKATKALVSLNKVDQHLIFIVEDNGIGLNEEVIHNPESIGLIGIQERIFGFNGQVQFEGFPEKGTKVTVKIPLVEE